MERAISGQINRFYGTVVGGILCTSIIVTGGKTYLSYPKSGNPLVHSNRNTTDIYITSKASNYSVYESLMADGSNTEETLIFNKEKKKSLERLDEIAKLKDNWNQMGATSFSNELITKVRNILIALERQPQIFPIDSNKIQLEYDGPDDSYLELEICNKNISEIFKIDRNGDETNSEIRSDAESINNLVNDFYG